MTSEITSIVGKLIASQVSWTDTINIDPEYKQCRGARLS